MSEVEFGPCRAPRKLARQPYRYIHDPIDNQEPSSLTWPARTCWAGCMSTRRMAACGAGSGGCCDRMAAALPKQPPFTIALPPVACRRALVCDDLLPRSRARGGGSFAAVLFCVDLFWEGVLPGRTWTSWMHQQIAFCSRKMIVFHHEALGYGEDSFEAAP